MRHKIKSVDVGLLIKQEQKPGRKINGARGKSVVVRILMILYVLAGSMGCYMSVTSSAKIASHKTIALLVVFMVSTCLVLLFDQRKLRLLKFALSVCSYCGVLIISKPVISESIQGIFQAVLYYLNPYYGWNIRAGAQQVNITTMSNTMGLIVLIIPVVIVLAYGITSVKHYYICVIPLGFGLSAPFLYGQVPGGWAVLFIVIAYCGILAMKRPAIYIEETSQFLFLEVQKKVGIILPSLAVLTIVCGIVVSQMIMEPLFSNPKLIKAKFEYAVEKYINISFDSDKAKGGVSNGNLGTADELVPDNQVQLKVVTDTLPDQTLYLQGYIGSQYSNNQWTEAKSKTLQKWNDGVLKEYTGVDIHNMVYDFISNSGSFFAAQKRTLEVEVVDSNVKYRYIPYGSRYREEDEVREDTYVYGRGEPVYSVDYYPMDGAVYRDYESVVDEIQATSAFDGEDYRVGTLPLNELEVIYEAYVRDHYLQVPDQIQNSFSAVAKEITENNAFYCAQQIAVILARHTEYSLKPGRTPFGEDFADYFYFENRRGYCVHYATVAALLLRMKQIPARFVSGYAVNPNDFRKLEDGSYEAQVTGDNAHAWAEAYYKGVGWLPVETTPGYYGSAVAAGNGNVLEEEAVPDSTTSDPDEELQEQPDEREEEQADQNDTIIQDETGADDDPKKKTENGLSLFGMSGRGKGIFVMVGKTILLLLGVILVAVCLLLARCRIIKKMRFQKGGKNFNEKIRLLFLEIYKVLIFGGLPPNTDCLDRAFIDRVKEVCPDISGQDVESFMELVMISNYGKLRMNKDDYLVVKCFYQACVISVETQLSRSRTLILRYIKCY